MTGEQPHPVIVALAGTGSAVELDGYIGESTRGSIRLHSDLSLERYIEVPEDSILHREASSDTPGRIKVYVRDSAKVVAVEKRTSAARNMSSGATSAGAQAAAPELTAARTALYRLERAAKDPGVSDDEISKAVCVVDCTLKYVDCVIDKMNDGAPAGLAKFMCEQTMNGCILRCGVIPTEPII